MAKIRCIRPFFHRPSSFLRFSLVTVTLLAGLWLFRLNIQNVVRVYPSLSQPISQKIVQSLQKVDPFSKKNRPASDSHQHHPIDKLIDDAQRDFAGLVSKQSKTVEEAAQAYRKRRGRHPPPRFDKWFEYAQSHNALVVEDFFDQIYHDLEPFWGIDPAPMRREASQFEMTINIRDGVAKAESDWFWTQIWLDMTKTIQHLLPDMDLALNAMDEPRIIVPWEDIDGYMKNAAKTVKLSNATTIENKFSRWPAPNTESLGGDVIEKNWEADEFFWNIARRGCAADSLARRTQLQTSFTDPPNITNDYAQPHLFEGYVSNYTMSVQLCHQPDLQGLEGILIHPLSTKSTKVLFPMFGGSKLSVNNEILLPAPIYWKDEERFSGGNNHGIRWRDKKNRAVWRGVATGGRNSENNWRGFHRHRFVSLNNETKISGAESGKAKPENFVIPPTEYNIQARHDNKLSQWVKWFADVSFIDLMCESSGAGECDHTGSYFKTTEGVRMAQQFDNKFLPDIDGNSFSGRYLGFLRSTSLPIKATIFQEWHDSRLIPWKHFVPMDNRFLDYFGIMDYFLGYRGKNAHDEAAEKIATEGKDWAERVLRKEDMSIYVLRLLLEYARVMDDNRESMGWVDDALKNPSLESTWNW